MNVKVPVNENRDIIPGVEGLDSMMETTDNLQMPTEDLMD